MYDSFDGSSYEVQRSPGELRVSIPSPYAPFSLVISLAITVGVIVAALTFASPLVSIFISAILGGLPPLLSVFILVVVLGVSAGFSSVLIYYLLCIVWSLFGREVITLRPEELEIERSIPLYSQTHTYSLENIRDMRIQARLYHNFPGIQFVALPLMNRSGGGPIVFEDRSGSYRMGLPLGVDEAEELVDTIAQSKIYQDYLQGRSGADSTSEGADSQNETYPETPRDRIRDVLDRNRADEIESLEDIFRGDIRDTEAYQKYGSFQHLKLESPLPPQECLRRIEMTTSDQSLFPSDLDPISAKIDGRRIRLRVRQRLKGRKNSFAPLLYGELKNAGESTRIEGTFKIHPFVKVFVLIFGLLLFSFGGAIVGMGLTGNLAVNPVWATLPFVFILGVAVLLWNFSSSWGREDRAELTFFLVKLLEAEIVEAESS